jgi:hypothetical protein
LNEQPKEASEVKETEEAPPRQPQDRDVFKLMADPLNIESKIFDQCQFDPEDMFQWNYTQPGHRLAKIDYQAIIDKGEPWKDPHFPPNAKSMFINGARHAD